MIFLHQSKSKEAMKWLSRLQQMDFQEQDNTLLYMWIDIQILGCFQDALIKFCQK
jgi:hypothetical protein